jgi:hypothetical protein
MNLLHALFTRNLLVSTVAIVRYIPRAFRVKQVDGNLFLTEEKRQEYRRRVESVTPQSPRQWGTMEVDQMLHHLNLACGGSLGFYNVPDESYLTSRTFFKWIIVDWFPEQPVGLRLPAGFKIPHSQRSKPTGTTAFASIRLMLGLPGGTCDLVGERVGRDRSHKFRINAGLYTDHCSTRQLDMDRS